MAKNFIVDNSVVMSWCFNDEANPFADSLLSLLEDTTAYVPSLWPLEVVNVLLAAERRKLISETDSIRFLSLLSQLPIIVQHENPEKVMKDILYLARAHNLLSYDASYLDLAVKKGSLLATLNKKMRMAAKSVKITTYPN
jgi:predicted nucleic acid-binding protein